ncbi:hypothetical protein [Clostridium gasigenes]|uniref:Uncharacterized protein n=1 Tax=Clostridium gasigenes TaxID=94869 RepID=A0A1H0UII9_9CLOT|nr:hypothetical protein [Clostridium gasigenes]MBB6623202.1 hypothetical protein [Clostridium gasigenes]MBU3087967.1 hypothetical protein [Clostridium gasigenes]SDP65994.1 hypothetical protein SAMN04488529_1119 [Clostridium gasigenes]
MRIILENNLCVNRSYINLKKLPIKTSLRRGTVNDAGFKSIYIIDQSTQDLCKDNNYTIEFSKGIEKITFDREQLNEMLLVEINYSSRSGFKSAKFKVFVVLGKIKYAIPFNSFEDVYNNCMDILARELHGTEELTYIKESFNNLESEEILVDINLNLERLAEFKDKVNYKRNIYYFVVNNVDSCTSKYDINNKTNEIEITDSVKVLRYNYNTRLYTLVKPSNSVTILKLVETDIVCDLGDATDKNSFPTVSIYTEYGLGKLLDIKNNVIPTSTTLSLFANILDLGLEVLN